MGDRLICDSRLARRLITYDLVPLVSGEPTTHSQIVVKDTGTQMWHVLACCTTPHKDSSPELLIHFCC